MDREFWLERWQKQEIGFHQDEVNPHLLQYWPGLDLNEGSEVFVPLCGKSRDMFWLRNRGHAIVGVELSDIAVKSFFAEHGYVPVKCSRGEFDIFEADGIRLLCGDFFELTGADLKDVTSVYDRASLVALPPDMREHYAMHLIDILRPSARILLVTFDYPQNEMSGPPFSISPEEVERLFGKRTEISLLAQENMLESNPRFRERGLTRLHENIFVLTRK